jgi:hypothetical protein
MKRNKIKNTPEFLLESGLLFEINRKILHPFGLALEVIVDDENKIAFGSIWDARDDAEGIVFEKDSFDVGREKFEKFMNDFGDMRLKTRLNNLGYTIQEEADNVLHDTDPDIKTDVSNLPPESEK